MFRFGADYYPEHWPETRWATDAKLMQEAGFNTVRLAEFACTISASISLPEPLGPMRTSTSLLTTSSVTS